MTPVIHKPTYATVLNCIDGDIQIPVINYMKDNCKVDHVDLVTEAGPARIICDPSEINHGATKSMFDLIRMSRNKHQSAILAIVGHHNCDFQKGSDEEKLEELKTAVQILKKNRSEFKKVFGLWVTEDRKVHRIR